jgi:hypothetical protein
MGVITLGAVIGSGNGFVSPNEESRKAIYAWVAFILIYRVINLI